MTSSSVARNDATRWCGSLPDESDGVREQHAIVLAEVDLAGERVEGGEQPVFNENLTCAGQATKNRRLAGVRVTNE